MREGRCAWGHPESFTPKPAVSSCRAEELELFSKEKPFSEAMATATEIQARVTIRKYFNFSVFSQ